MSSKTLRQRRRATLSDQYGPPSLLLGSCWSSCDKSCHLPAERLDRLAASQSARHDNWVCNPRRPPWCPALSARSHAKLVVVAVKIIIVFCDDFAFEILPWPMPNAIASVYGLCSSGRLGTEISLPGLVTCTCRLRQCLTLTIRAFQAAEISPLTGTGARNEECHVRRLWWRRLCPANSRSRCDQSR
jgi:hypothetical protein